MRAWLVALAVVLAGCAGSSEAEAEPDAFRDLESDSDKGLIRGVVVDQSIQPVADARIELNPGDLETTTDADGAFAFTDLEPGFYFITASAPYHTAVQTSVDVEAGVKKPPIVRIAIQALPKPVPAIQEFQYRFVTSASVWIGGVIGVVASDFIGDGHYAHTFELAANVSWVQGELMWSPQQPLAESMRLAGELDDGDNDVEKVVVGSSPLLMTFEEEDVPGQGELSLATIIFIHNGDLPVGVAANQDAEFILHSFHHFVPDEGWRFSSDGAHPVPSPP